MSLSDDRLRLLVERIERIEEEIRGAQQDRRDVYAEAKAVGYDPAIIRKVIARRRIDPADRAEADHLVETYEAALGSGAWRDDETAPAEGPQARPGARSGSGEAGNSREDLKDIATDILAEQLAAIEDPERAANLVDHVSGLLDIRAEIALLRRQEGERRKLAKGDGWIVAQLVQAVKWIEKCAKHGREPMRAGEATYHLYRATAEQHGGVAAPVTGDATLQAAFGRQPALPRAASALAWHDVEG